MKGIEIIELNLIADNEKGKTFEFPNRNAEKLLLIKRKKGTISGGHYHTGKNPMKDPETILIIDGEMEMTFRNVKTGEEIIEIYNRPIIFKISPYIYHKIKALTDVIFMDMNSIKDDDDTIRKETL